MIVREKVVSYNDIKTGDLFEIDVVNNVIEKNVGCSVGFFRWLKKYEGKTIKFKCSDGDGEFKCIVYDEDDGYWYFTLREEDIGKDQGINVFELDRNEYKDIYFVN